jgi:hypothetical protein
MFRALITLVPCLSILACTSGLGSDSEGADTVVDTGELTDGGSTATSESSESSTEATTSTEETTTSADGSSEETDGLAKARRRGGGGVS